jgi:uncharacterized protein with NRDE domain
MYCYGFQLVLCHNVHCTTGALAEKAEPITGSIQITRRESPVGLQGSRWGTRSQSLIFITYEGHVEWVERTRQADEYWLTDSFSFQLSQQPPPADNDVATQDREL